MHTRVAKPKVIQRTSSALPSTGGRRRAVHGLDAIQSLQRSGGNQAVQRLYSGERSGRPGAAPFIRFNHGLNRIPMPYPAAGLSSRGRTGPNGLGADDRGGQRAAAAAAVGPIQTKLTINAPGDVYEQEADRVAAQVMRMPAPRLQRACACDGTLPASKAGQPGGRMEALQTKQVQAGGQGLTAAPAGFHAAMAAAGRPLESGTRRFMESRFGHDFGSVRVHTDAAASRMNEALGARAFAYGSDIYFDSGEYRTHSGEGRRLLAHELTHVIQQQGGGARRKIQRDCSDPTFCTPYATAAEIADAKAYLLDYFVPALDAYFGSDVGGLWRRFLSRKPGDSLTRTTFNTEGNSIYDSFSDNNYIHDETDHVLDLIAARLDRGYGNVTQPITNFLSPAEMDLDTNFANPFTIPGNIAGGIGSSDAGMDSRKITWGQVSFDVTSLPIGGNIVNIEVILGFEVKDAIDFCPGDCGAILEQTLATIKMSRLEASGEAYDVPFVVRFTGPRKNKRVID